jgi:hypothetical protein
MIKNRIKIEILIELGMKELVKYQSKMIQDKSKIFS